MAATEKHAYILPYTISFYLQQMDPFTRIHLQTSLLSYFEKHATNMCVLCVKVINACN